MIWIFDFIDEYKYQMTFYDEWNKKHDNGGKYSWKNPKKFFKDFIPQWNKDNIILMFQFHDENDEIFENMEIDEKCIIEKVIWAIEEDNSSNFKRFFTSYYPGTIKEFKKCLNKNKI